MGRRKLLLSVGLIGFAGILVVVALALNKGSSDASVIPPMSSMEQARELSKGKKGACLADNQQAADAVRKDDTYIDNDPEWSNFDLSASNGIMDVPAGTNYEVTINTYDGKTATGTVDYDADYGTYNYIIEKGADAGSWTFQSMTACE